MEIYRTKIKPVPGTNYSEVYPRAWALYKQIASKTKRRPYVRSAYFNKEKVFLDLFWEHVRQKNLRDRARRLKYYPCALDLIGYSRIRPSSQLNPMRKSEILHRFTGIYMDKLFHVQIKEYKSGEKHFISIFP
jgi:hypothetical protein